jgi:hypothetical protein
MTAAELAPAILLSSFNGVLRRPWDRKRILVVRQPAPGPRRRAPLLLVGEGWLWVVYVVAALQSTAAAFSAAGRGSTAADAGAVGELVQANALNALNNRWDGSSACPLGAALLSWWGLDRRGRRRRDHVPVAAALIAPISAPARRPTRRSYRAAALLARVDRRRYASSATTGRSRCLFVVFGLMTFGGTMLDPLYVPRIRDARRGRRVVACSP